MTAKRQLRPAAQVAKLCKQYIKGLGLECSAKSDNFSMGDSVDVRVTNATGAQRKQIEEELSKYEYGKFNGMEDIYEHTNWRDDIPQTKFLHIRFDYSDEFEQRFYEWAREHVLSTEDQERLPVLYSECDKSARLTHNEFLSSEVYRVGSGARYRTEWEGDDCKRLTFWDDYKPAKLEEVPKNKPKTEGAQVHEIYHTKKEYHIYIVTLPSMERDEFNDVRDYVKSIGGWYSRKWGDSPAGFAFNTKAEAEAFAAGIDPGPGSGKPTEKPAQNDSDRNEKIADKLEDIAAKAACLAEDKLADRLTNTQKRLAQAMSARIEGQRLERVCIAAGALAKQWRDGTIPEDLKCYTSKKAIYDALPAMLEPVSNGYHGYHVETGEPGANCDTKLWALAQGESDAKPLELVKLENAVKFADIPGFFPTPAEVAQKMYDAVSYTERTNEAPRILEPSAGSGALCELARAKWPLCSLLAIERNHTLSELLKHKENNVLHADFMSLEPKPEFDLVFMNPPFEKMQDIDHIMRAWEWLDNESGELIAIASAGVLFRDDKKTTEFRKWVELRGHIEPLPEGSFKESGTGVNTVLIRVTKFNNGGYK